MAKKGFVNTRSKEYRITTLSGKTYNEKLTQEGVRALIRSGKVITVLPIDYKLIFRENKLEH